MTSTANLITMATAPTATQVASAIKADLARIAGTFVQADPLSMDLPRRISCDRLKMHVAKDLLLDLVDSDERELIDDLFNALTADRADRFCAYDTLAKTAGELTGEPV